MMLSVIEYERTVTSWFPKSCSEKDLGQVESRGEDK